MNISITAVKPDEPLPLTQMMSKEAGLIKDKTQMLASNDGKGGGGGCIGRACYDHEVVASACARAEMDSYNNAFQNDDDATGAQAVEVALAKRRVATTTGCECN